MDLSLAGLLGAVVGTIASALIYGPLVGPIERALRRGREPSDDQSTFSTEIALLRRSVLAADMLICAGLGYWVGQRIGG